MRVTLFLINDTHTKKLTLLNSEQKVVEMQGWLLLHMFTHQLGSFNSIIVTYICLKNVIIK